MTIEQVPLTAFVLLFGGLILILPLQGPLPGFGVSGMTELFVILPGLAAGVWAGVSGIGQCRYRITGIAILSILAGMFSVAYLIAVGVFLLQ